ncbi:MAG TPA: DNRLRE domain-containing protein [Chthoniobacteraceae bacterium]|nr:DNRLRE domain-containing protein [Chthoniobacteraceae bacterium]
MKTVPGLLALLALLSPAPAQSAVVTFQQGADNEWVSDYTGTSDTQLATNSKNATAGDLDFFLVGRNQTRYSIIRFDLSSLQGAPLSVSSATITLTRTGNATAADFDIEVHSVAATNGGWDEMTASWAHLNATAETPWKNAAGDDQVAFSGAVGALHQSVAYSTTSDSFTFEVPLAVLQQWIDAPSSSGGLALVPVGSNGDNANAAYFGSSEHATMAYRPLLTIHYAAIPEPSVAVIGLGGLGLVWVFSRKRR